MNLFGFRRPGVTVVKAWCSPFYVDVDGPAGEYLALIDRLLALLPSASLDGCVNAGELQPLPSLRRALAKMRAVDVESLFLVDEAGEPVLSVVIDPLATAGATVFAFVVVLSPAAQAARDPLLQALAGQRLHYAYARSLATHCSPLSEVRSSRSWFRPPQRVPGPREGWLVPEPDVRTGAVRGLFPVNILSALALARLSGSGLRLPPSVPASGGVLWRVDAAEQQEIVRRNPDFKAYLHFGHS